MGEMEARAARRMRPGAVLLGATLALVSPVTGCIYDESDRCSSGQVLDEGLCRCPPGATIVGNACVLSIMDAGLDASTEVSDAGLGAACDPSRPCTDPSYASCQTAPSGRRYCTSTGCTSSSECGGGYVCATGASPTYCRPLYTGQGVPCASAVTCGGDATFCSPLLSICMVQDCTDTSCDPGYTCLRAGDFVPGTPNVCVGSELLGQ